MKGQWTLDSLCLLVDFARLDWFTNCAFAGPAGSGCGLQFIKIFRQTNISLWRTSWFSINNLIIHYSGIFGRYKKKISKKKLINNFGKIKFFTKRKVI